MPRPRSQTNGKAHAVPVYPINQPPEELNEGPVNREAERYTLAGILRDASHYRRALQLGLQIDHFSLWVDREIFSVIGDLADCEDHINTVTVYDELKRRGQAGGDTLSYLHSLEDGMPELTAATFQSYVKIVRRDSNKRRAVAIAQKLKAEILGSPGKLDEILASHTTAIRDLERENARGQKHGWARQPRPAAPSGRIACPDFWISAG
jgi:replicative DNA helicase